MKKKLTEAQRLREHHQVHQHMDNMNHRRGKRIFEEIMAKKFPNLTKTLIYTSKKFNKHETVLTEKDPTLDTSKSNFQNPEKRQNLESRDVIGHIQGILNKINNYEKPWSQEAVS